MKHAPQVWQLCDCNLQNHLCGVVQLTQLRCEYVRAVRAMNESLKQNRLPREEGESGSYSFGPKDQHDSGQPKDVCFLSPVIMLLLWLSLSALVC